LVTNHRQPRLDRLVPLQLGVQEVAQRVGGVEQRREVVVESREVAFDGGDRLLPHRRDVAAPEERGGAHPIGVTDGQGLDDPTAHRVADEAGRGDAEMVQQRQSVGNEVLHGVRGGR
jgi:hypothetical protein